MRAAGDTGSSSAGRGGDRVAPDRHADLVVPALPWLHDGRTSVRAGPLRIEELTRARSRAPSVRGWATPIGTGAGACPPYRRGSVSAVQAISMPRPPSRLETAALANPSWPARTAECSNAASVVCSVGCGSHARSSWMRPSPRVYGCPLGARTGSPRSGEPPHRTGQLVCGERDWLLPGPFVQRCWAVTTIQGESAPRRCAFSARSPSPATGPRPSRRSPPARDPPPERIADGQIWKNRPESRRATHVPPSRSS